MAGTWGREEERGRKGAGKIKGRREGWREGKC